MEESIEMRLQVLMSVMHQVDHDIVRRSNLRTDAIIINQADNFKIESFTDNGSIIKFFTLKERGVGLSRNTALMRADADLVIFADDDIRYVDDYEHIIVSEFEKNPRADIIMFNVPSTNPDRPSANITKQKRIRRYNSLRYGTVGMALRVDRVREKNLFFSLLFGGGAKYSSGEDSLFIYNAIKSGLKIYGVPKTIGYVSQESSTWFNGYTEKFFKDKAVLFRTLSPKLSAIYICRFIIRGRKQFSQDIAVKDILRLMFTRDK